MHETINRRHARDHQQETCTRPSTGDIHETINRRHTGDHQQETYVRPSTGDIQETINRRHTRDHQQETYTRPSTGDIHETINRTAVFICRYWTIEREDNIIMWTDIKSTHSFFLHSRDLAGYKWIEHCILLYNINNSIDK